jgi:hypothetical protein
MVFGIIALTIINLIGWGRFNFRLAEQGYLSNEFVVNWVAARALIIDSTSPYHPDVTRSILSELSKSPAAELDNVPQFTSPLYAILPILPFAMIDDLQIAQAAWMTTQEVILVVLILVSLWLSNVKPGKAIFSLFVLTTFLGYHALAPILSGSMIILAGLFLLLSLTSIQTGRDEVAGVFLGLVTIQLPFLILPIALILIWALIKRKKLLALWFLGSVVLLTVLGIFLVRDWLLQYSAILLRFSLFFPASTPGAAFRNFWPGIGVLMAWGLTAITALTLIVEWWLAGREEFPGFLWAVGLTLVLSNWIGLPSLPENLVLLIIPLIMCIGAWSERWGRMGSVIAATSMLVIFFWEWWLVVANLYSLRQVDALKLLLPMPLVCLIGLYWVRQVIIHPKRLLVEELRAREHV